MNQHNIYMFHVMEINMECIQVEAGPSHPTLPLRNSEYSSATLVKRGFLKNSSVDRDTSTTIANGGYSGDYAVFIRNLRKRYQLGSPILRNFCMNVRKGTIYGLLGSSGCGKTTVLSCIVGLQKFDSGELLVFGKIPGAKDSGIPGRRLGYMPQELALYNHLTIMETVQFYGRVYTMKKINIEDQWDFLNTLLQLPSNAKLIKDLSGGQQRRVSLALALIHSPELLILDEPTVGLDPLLRTTIWEYLYKIVQKLGTAIIITTHYIEEARNANTIGVMRNGRLLAENTPVNLLRDYESELLEEVVLQLCKKDHSHIKELPLPISCSDEQEVGVDIPQQTRMVKNYFGTNMGQKDKNWGFVSAFRRIYGFSMVVLLTVLRNPAFLGITLFMPTIQGSLTFLTLGTQPRELPIGVVNHELANWTLECDSPRHFGNFCDFSALSCNFLNKLKRNDLFVFNPYDTYSEALSQAHLGKISGFLLFPANYSQHSLDLMTSQRFSLNETIEGSRIHVRLDYSQQIKVLLMIQHLFSSYLSYIKDLSTSCQIGGQQAELPMLFRKPLYGKEDDYTTFIIPGIIIGSVAIVGYILSGVMLVTDRKEGTLRRAHVAGLTISDVLISHLLVQAIVSVSQILLWNVIIYFGFGFKSVGSPWLMMVLYMLTQLGGGATGIFAAQFFDEEMHVIATVIFLFSYFFHFACAVFPMELMLPMFRYFAYVIPTTLPSIALRALTVRGIGITHPLVWTGVSVLLTWTAIVLIFSVMIYKKFNK